VTRPIIAWVTDFGTRDHYVAAMKAVALGVCPDATFVDITHEIQPQDVLGGAIELAACYRDFPDRTVFVAVVDPGVGSTRRAIAASAGRHTFVAPDNGVLTMVLGEAEAVEVVELSNAEYARPVISRTFEGRDRFAPAAGWLASGVEMSRLGRPVDPATLTRLSIAAAVRESDGLRGQVMRVDRFGNLVTNIHETELGALGPPASLIVHVGSRHIASMVATYAAALPGSLCALVGSSGHLEIAVNGGSARAAAGAGRGAVVHVARRA
jgi:S-adenosyl-L-methionine hydrolase (adenosine-forming)